MCDINKILTYWFNNDNIWFNATIDDDKYIKDTFGDYLDNDIKYWCRTSDGCLAYIIINDQFSRHIYRNTNNDISKYDSNALNATFYAIENGYDYKYTPEQRCFMLLPLRHSREKHFIKCSINKIMGYRKEEDNPIYRRFYKASLRSLSDILNYECKESTTYLNDFSDICDFWTINKPQLVEHSDIFNTIKFSIPKYTNNIVISLSGGVDSMVCSYVLSHLNLNVIAVSINYGNRDTSYKEAEFVKWWCKKINIKCYVRNITEIKRSRDYDRSIYEDITREIRFNMYKRFGYPVILGHNYDDTIENIFSNISKKLNYNNLKGMTKFSKEKGVDIWRPLIKVKKDDIIKFAEINNIPYLYDSTPSWSRRGQMRDKLIPFINDFDPNLINGLVELSETQSNMNNIIEKFVLQPFLQKLQFSNNSCMLNIDNHRDNGLLFWRKVINYIFNKLEISQPSLKSITNLHFFIRNNKDAKIILNKNTNCYIKKNRIFIIF